MICLLRLFTVLSIWVLFAVIQVQIFIIYFYLFYIFRRVFFQLLNAVAARQRFEQVKTLNLGLELYLSIA